MAPRTTPREAEDRHFARTVAAEAKRRAQGCGAVVLAAPPRFLGLLRHELDADTSARIVAWIPKDLTSVRALDIPATVKRHLPPVRIQKGTKRSK